MGDKSIFQLIREWAEEKGIFSSGSVAKQYEKLMEEAGELGRALIEHDQPEIEDAIGDMVVVLTSLAKLNDTTIEQCIQGSYNVISKRTGKMINGTFVKDS